MTTKVNVVEAYSLFAWIHSYILRFIEDNGIAHNHEEKADIAIPFSCVPIASIARNLLSTAFPEFDKSTIQDDWEAVSSIFTTFYERPLLLEFRSLPQRLKWPIQLDALPEHGIPQIINCDANFIKVLELLLGVLVQSRMREGYIRDILSLENNLQVNLMTIIDRNLQDSNARTAETGESHDEDVIRVGTCNKDQPHDYDDITIKALETEFSSKEVLARLKRENQLLKEENVYLGVSIEKSRREEKTWRIAHDKLQEAMDEMKLDSDVQLLKKERQIRSLYEDQITTLRNELTEVQLKSREQCNLMQQISSLQDEVDLLRPAAERTGKAEITIIKFKAKIEELNHGKEKMHLLESSNESLRNRVMELETEMEKAKSLQRRLSEAKNATTTANVRVSELKVQLSMKSAEADYLLTENETLRNSLKEAQSMLNQSTTMANEAVNVYEQESAAVDMLMSEYNPEISEKIARLEHENQELGKRVKNESSENLEKLLDQLDDTNRLKALFEQKYHQSKDEFAVTSAAKFICEQQLAEWKMTCAMQNEELLQQRYRCEELSVEIRNAQAENTFQREEVVNCEAKIEEMLMELEKRSQACHFISKSFEESKCAYSQMQWTLSNRIDMQLEELNTLKCRHQQLSQRHKMLQLSHESLSKCAHDQKVCIHRLEMENANLIDKARDRSVKLQIANQSVDKSEMLVNDLENHVCKQQILLMFSSERIDEMAFTMNVNRNILMMSIEDLRSLLAWRQEQQQNQLQVSDREIRDWRRRYRVLRESMQVREGKLLVEFETMSRVFSIKLTRMEETSMEQCHARIEAQEERIVALLKNQLSSFADVKGKTQDVSRRIENLQQEKNDASEKLCEQLLLNDQIRYKQQSLEILNQTTRECLQMATEDAETLAYDLVLLRDDRRMHQLAIENGRKQYLNLEEKLKLLKVSARSIAKEKENLTHQIQRLQTQFDASEHTVTTLESKLIRLERERSHFTGASDQKRHIDDEKVSITADLSMQVKLLSAELKRAQEEALNGSEIGKASLPSADSESSVNEKEANGAKLDYSQLLERLETVRKTEGSKRREILLFNATLLQTQHQLMEKNKVLCQEIQQVNERLNRALLENERNQQRWEVSALQCGSDTVPSALGKRKLMEQDEKARELKGIVSTNCTKKKKTLFAQNKEWIESVSNTATKPSECTQQ